MLLIPEINKVVITPPRTGSTTLRAAVLARYPKAISLYRHMEADGVPIGWEDAEKVMLWRDDLPRLISLWKYMGEVTTDRATNAPASWVRRQNREGALPFHEWLTNSVEIFSDPYDGAYKKVPYYRTKRPIPITRKSIADYDAGLCDVWLDVQTAAVHLGLGPLEVLNSTRPPLPSHTDEMWANTAKVNEFMDTFHTYNRDKLITSIT